MRHQCDIRCTQARCITRAVHGRDRVLLAVLSGMTVSQDSLIELTSADQRIYLSPGGLDEGMKFYLHRQTMPLAEIRKLEGRCTGVLDEGEQISLKVLPIAHLRGVYDCKTLVALSLYAKSPSLF